MGKIKFIYFYLSLERCEGEAYINLHKVSLGFTMLPLISFYMFILLLYIYYNNQNRCFLFDSARCLLDPVCIFTTELGFLLISGKGLSLPKKFNFGQIGCQEVCIKHICPITCTKNKVWEKSN